MLFLRYDHFSTSCKNANIPCFPAPDTHLGARPRVPGRVREISLFRTFGGRPNHQSGCGSKFLTLCKAPLQYATKEKWGRALLCSIIIIPIISIIFEIFILIGQPERFFLLSIRSCLCLIFVGQQFRNETEAKEF